MLRHWSQFVPNMSTDIRGHEALPNHHQGLICYICVFLVKRRTLTDYKWSEWTTGSLTQSTGSSVRSVMHAYTYTWTASVHTGVDYKIFNAVYMVFSEFCNTCVHVYMDCVDAGVGYRISKAATYLQRVNNAGVCNIR